MEPQIGSIASARIFMESDSIDSVIEAESNAREAFLLQSEKANLVLQVSNGGKATNVSTEKVKVDASGNEADAFIYDFEAKAISKGVGVV